MYFGDIAIDIYDSTLLLEGSAYSYKQDTFLDLYIRVVDGKFVTGICHYVDDFNFEVISYPFPQSNIHSMLGYPTFYSQQFVSLDFVITSMISCFGQNVAIPSWSNMVICIAFQKILFGLQNKRKIWRKKYVIILAYDQIQSLCFLWYK